MKRLDYLDNIAGILICYMMLMHILLWKTIPLDNNSLWLEPLSLAMAPWCCLSLGVANDLEEPEEGEAAICGACVAEV